MSSCFILGLERLLFEVAKATDKGRLLAQEQGQGADAQDIAFALPAVYPCGLC